MEFALNGLLRPEEEKYDLLKNKGFPVNGAKQKAYKTPLDMGIFGNNNGNMFNVQKHLNYYQNPKH